MDTKKILEWLGNNAGIVVVCVVLILFIGLRDNDKKGRTEDHVLDTRERKEHQSKLSEHSRTDQHHCRWLQTGPETWTATSNVFILSIHGIEQSNSTGSSNLSGSNEQESRHYWLGSWPVRIDGNRIFGFSRSDRDRFSGSGTTVFGSELPTRMAKEKERIRGGDGEEGKGTISQRKGRTSFFKRHFKSRKGDVAKTSEGVATNR